MSVPSYRDPFSRVDAFLPKGQMETADSTDLLSDQFAEIIQEPRRTKLLGLQQWICELLIKNQQLRMTLMEMKTREQEYGCGRDG
jgi:hypothetical protein